MKITYVIGLSGCLAIALAGCGKSSSNSNSPGGADIDAQLRGEAAKAAPLAPGSEAAIAALIKTTTLKLPSAQAVINAANGNPSPTDTASLDADGLATFATMKQNCQANRTDKPDGTGSTSTVSGANCAINYSDVTTSNPHLSPGHTSQTISGTIGSTDQNTTSVIDPNLQQQSGVTQETMQTTATITFTDFQFGQSSKGVGAGSMNVIGHGDGDFTFASAGKVPMHFDMQYKISSGHSKISMLMKGQFPQGELVLGYFISDTAVEIYVNGKPYTAEQFQAEFGGAIMPSAPTHGLAAIANMNVNN